MTFPQVVAGSSNGQKFSTRLTAQSKHGAACNILIALHRGNETPPGVPLLVNGQDMGNTFMDSIAPYGTASYEVSVDGESLFEGGATIDILSADCAPSLSFLGGYLVLSSLAGSNSGLDRGMSEAGQISSDRYRIDEAFLFPPARQAGIGSCFRAPVQLDLDSSDGVTSNPGLAAISLNSVNLDMCLDLWDAEGNPLTQTSCRSYNGSHTTSLLTELFPDQGSFIGSLRACFPGQKPMGFPATIDLQVIQIFQDQMGTFQFGSGGGQIENSSGSNPCVADSETLCQLQDRFQVQVDWSNGASGGKARVGGITSDGSGLFWFLDPSNTELLVRVIDNCSTPGFDHFWVFAAGLTDLDVTLSVVDTQTGQSREYGSPLGTPFEAIVDTTAFATCP